MLLKIQLNVESRNFSIQVAEAMEVAGVKRGSLNAKARFLQQNRKLVNIRFRMAPHFPDLYSCDFYLWEAFEGGIRKKVLSSIKQHVIDVILSFNVRKCFRLTDFKINLSLVQIIP